MLRTLCSTLTAAALVTACGGNKNNGDGGSSDAGPTCQVGDANYPINCTFDPGFTETSPNTANTISVTFTGETLGIAGLPYVPNIAGDPYFVDGWSVRFYEYIVVFGNVRLNKNPTQDATWSDMGAQVAVKPGPYVVDAHEAHGFIGKDGAEPAEGLFVWNQLDDGTAFDTSQRYAFSYDIMKAQYPATNVNLSSSGLQDYDRMVSQGWSKFIRGRADFTAQGSYPDAGVQAKFAALPQTIYFAMGWDDHGQLLNCVNTDNGDGKEDNLANRGVQTNNNGTYIAQVTIHTDHIFWDTLEHEGEPLRFDPIAAWAPATTTLASPFWINNLTQQKLATVFQDGSPLPDRGPFLTGNGQPFTSDMAGPQVIMNSAGVSTVPATSYPDFMAFSVQSQPHLNAQGLCYVVGQHASDPYYAPSVQPYTP